jgi:glucose/arabinose dehydrogenase
MKSHLLAGGLAALTLVAACSSASPMLAGAAGTSGGATAGTTGTTGSSGTTGTAGATTPTDANTSAPTYCGRGVDVPGVTPPAGFCVKQYAKVAVARTLVVAPNGDVFVGAPSHPTNGGASGGPGAIVVLTDDDHDGVASQSVFAKNIPDVHGLALGGGFLSFTTQDDVWRTPYVDGQRAETGTRQKLGLPVVYSNSGRWTHGLAQTVSGQLITSRGEYGTCGVSMGGDISSIGAAGALTTIANGFRNPMYLRCHDKDDVCAATELGEDLATGAREKLLILHPSSNYGYPCCYTTALPAGSATAAMCGAVTKEDASFVLSDTPFGLDWEKGLWPAPYQNALFVALHGSFYSTPSWAGARLVFASTDPTTHAPTQPWQDFLTGFGPDGTILDRPSDVAFGPDGRLFFSDDTSGYVFWIAPTTLMAPN